MAAIRVLAPELVSKIAAGEVVERPASVVKELVENALDAGASAIRVEVQRGGFTLIRVTDNGSGIAPDDMELAVRRHATSKLASLDDLFRVQTLGFRGEALASIAAVSHLEVMSRAAGQPAGRLLRVEGGRIVHRATTGCPQGTTISVRHLFFNVPARQAFQRSPSGEARQIVSLCNQLALTAPHVRLLVELDGRTALQAPGNGNLRETLAATYGARAAEHMLALPELEEAGVTVSGFCSGPEEHRNTRLYNTFCVNGRLVRSQMLTYAVEEAYHALLPGGRHPLAAVHLRVPPDEVDVNVHPAKTEVRLRRDRLAFALIRDAVRQALAAYAPVPVLVVGGQGLVGAPGPAAGGRGDETGREPASGTVGAQFIAPDGPTPQQAREAHVQGALTHRERESSASRGESQPAPGARSPAPGPQGEPATGRLRPLAQVALTYVVAEDATGMYLIDQHSAHERVVYEQLLRAESGGEAPAIGAQLLLQPEVVRLNGMQAAWLAEHAATLAQFGFQLEPFGGDAWLVRAVPPTMRSGRGRGLEHALADLIDGLFERQYGDGPLHDQARWAVACHSAVRAGDALTLSEMAALIEQLERCDMRRTCPHGRPTMIHLSHAQLAREFGRR